MRHINKVINNYIMTHLEDLPPIYNDLFVEDLGDAVMSRHDPSNAAERRHIDGSRQGITSVSFYTRSKNATNALKWADMIVNLLDSLEIEDAENNLFLACEVTSNPQFISVDDAEQKIFMATISVDYTIAE